MMIGLWFETDSMITRWGYCAASARIPTVSLYENSVLARCLASSHCFIWRCISGRRPVFHPFSMWGGGHDLGLRLPGGHTSPARSGWIDLAHTIYWP